jgi:hypothetical protein
MTSKINGTAVRSTAATRLVFEDLQVPDLIADLEKSSEVIKSRIEMLAEANKALLEATIQRDEFVDSITQNTIEQYESELVSPDVPDVTKRVQAEIDRRIKAALGSSHQLSDLNGVLDDAKIQAIAYQADFDAEKFNHRTLSAKASLTTASLRFLGDSKSARAAALNHLAEL